MAMHNFRELLVWQESVQLVSVVYQHTAHFPEEEKFGITNQIRRSAVSVPSNIAEGAGRGSDRDFVRFIQISIGSSYELETQLIISRNLGYLNQASFEVLLSQLQDVQRKLLGLQKRLNKGIIGFLLSLFW